MTQADGPYRTRRPAAERLADPLVRELLEARLIATLATFNVDASVHLVAMWFLWADGELLVPTSAATRKAKNLRRDPRATVMVDDSRGGFDLRGATLVCRAAITEGPEALELNRRVHLKYVTERGLALEPVASYLATDDVTLRLRPVSVSSWDLRSTPQAAALAEAGEARPLG
jgi:PPOX class probable F420-dependent enzyme